MVVLTIPSQQYTPRTINTTFNVAANTTRLRTTFRCVGWPTGEVGSVALTQPDGSGGGARNFLGGALGRDGQPRTEQSMDIQINSALQAGTWGVQFNIIQTLTTKVTVERF